MSHICCKRIAGGVCQHDVDEAKSGLDLRRAQIRHDMTRPGISRWDRERLQKDLDAIVDPTMDTLCPKCHKTLKPGQSHYSETESDQGFYSSWYCNQYQ